jgi:predicted SprT family Zn-dependent metalloprotease
MIISLLDISKRKFGKLRIKTPQDILSGSHEKILWVCDCGKEAYIKIANVVNENTKSCGKCKEILVERDKKFGRLHIKTSQFLKLGSHEKILWVCDCGKEKLIGVFYVLSGNTTSCRQCRLITAEEITHKKYGKLQIKIPQDVMPGSMKKVKWICDCGKETMKSIQLVLKKETKSCGRCKEISAEEISKMKFGKLRIKTPQDILPGSEKKLKWTCDCGKITISKINNVINGNTKSCGDCHGTIYNWYIKNKDIIRSLRCPILPNQVPIGGIVPTESIKFTNRRFKALCPACQKPWTALWNDIRLGLSLTCGCSNNRISATQRRIYEYLKQFDPDVQLEYKLGSYHYDIFAPSKNLLIEYDGVLYHAFPKSKQRDLKKQKLAIDSGYKFMRILEQDWLKNKQEVLIRLSDLF